jgi:Mor family transcriptional regulator
MNEQAEMPLGEVGLSGALAAGLEPPAEKWARTLAEMVDVLAADRRRRGEDEDVALADAQHTVLVLAEYQGGRQYYLPRGAALRNALRDRVIYHQAKRGNIDTLAERYGITTRRVEQIVAEQHAIQVRSRQGQLFAG